MKKFNMVSLGLSIKLTVVALVMAVTGVVAGFAPSASAAGCRNYEAITYYGFEPDGILWTNNYVVPSWSTCNDINIKYFRYYNGGDRCGSIRVRFYPSSGGNYVNSWTTVCPAPAIVATNVANGTNYRLEIAGATVSRIGAFD